MGRGGEGAAGCGCGGELIRCRDLDAHGIIWAVLTGLVSLFSLALVPPASKNPIKPRLHLLLHPLCNM